MTNGRRGTVLLILAALCGLLALFTVVTGGIDTRIAGIAVRSRSWQRPAAIGAAFAAAGLFFLRASLSRIAPAGLRLLPAAALCWAAVAGLWFGTYAAGGADSSGYLSQAQLFARGQVTDRLPLHPAFSWPDVRYTLTPLGYTRGPDPGALVPIYPPGLPLLMAPLVGIHPRAVFLLVPVCAVLAVWCCLRLGRELGDRLAGTLGAVLLSCSPTFLLQAVQPMSDVPVTAFWVGALTVARRMTPAGAALAGLLASIAVLIRPNLAPLVAFVAAVCATGAPAGRVRRAAICAAAMLPGLLALGIVQNVRYGSPFAAGYGSVDSLFALSNIGPNLARYPRWLTASHSPFVWVWLLAPLWIVRAPPVVRGFAWVCYGFCIAVVAAYLPYVYFRPDEWSYTRFLLPALPLMLVLGVIATRFAAMQLAARSGPVVTAWCLALAAWCVVTAAGLGVFQLRDGEQKYPAVGRFVRDSLPRSAFVMALQHSGSIRYYSGRATLRWDLLDRASLDRAVRSLREAGFDPFVVLDEGEDHAFRQRFTAAAQQSVAALVPIATFGNTTVYGFR